MPVEYPDVLNDMLDARQRFESGAVQFLAEFAAPITPAGQVVELSLYMQNVLDVPTGVAIRVGLPEIKGKLKRVPPPPFRIFQPEISLKLEEAEVARLTIPVHISPQVPPDEYACAISLRTAPTAQGSRVRPAQGVNRLGDLGIRYLQGLGITQIVSCGFKSIEGQTQTLPLKVSQAGDPNAPAPAPADLKPQFSSLWTLPDWDLIPPAIREVNERRIHIMPDLTPQKLYLPLMKECQNLLTDCGVRLHVGEAIFIAKMLTFTVIYMARKPEWLDALLTPIYAFAQVNDQPTDNIVELLSQLGLTQVIEMSVALGYSLVENALQRQLWDRYEQKMVREYIINSLTEGSDLMIETLYPSLVLGGLVTAREVTMEGEDVRQSAALLGRARDSRTDPFADPDLQPLKAALDYLLKRQSAS